MDKILKDLFTECNNENFDLTLVLGALSVIAAFIFTAYGLYHGKDFDIITFSTGITALIVGTSASSRIKPSTPNTLNTPNTPKE